MGRLDLTWITVELAAYLAGVVAVLVVGLMIWTALTSEGDQ